MIRHILAVAALATLPFATSCSAESGSAGGATAEGATRYAGYYRSGFEQSNFWSEDGEGPWWLTADGEAWDMLMEHYVDGPGRGGGITVRLVVEGQLSGPGEYGNVGAYDHELVVERVLEVAPLSAEEFETIVQGFSEATD